MKPATTVARPEALMPQPSTALVVVDSQELFRHRPFFRDADLPCFLDHARALVA